MKTAEEILKKKFEQQQMFSDMEHWSYKYVVEAMEEYANQFKNKGYEFTCKSVKHPNIKGYKLYTLDGKFLGELSCDSETK